MACPKSLSAFSSSPSDRLSDVQQRLMRKVPREPHLSRDSERSRWGIVLEKQRYATAKQRSEAAPARAQQMERETPVTQQQPAPQVKPDPKAQSWAEKNKWFGEDRIMTTAAIAIHQTLIEDEGFDPSSNEYYTEIDRRLRTEFPHKFAARKPGGGSQVAPAGNSASRSTTQERRTVRLTPSQVAIAKRLNVPLEEYAKYVKD